MFEKGGMEILSFFNNTVYVCVHLNIYVYRMKS